MSRPALGPAVIERRATALGRAGVAFGPNAIGLLFLGIGWLVPAFVDRRFVAGLLLWDGLVVAACLLDLTRLPAPQHLTIRREWLGPPALSVRSEVALTVANGSGQPVSVRIVDSLPGPLCTTPPQLTTKVRAHGEAVLRYPITPAVRGPLEIGPVYLRYTTFLRLAERWARADLSQTVVSYPNMTEARHYALYLVRSRQIELEKRSARIRGAGRAFESLREYRPGDDARDICWTASARRGKLVTRLYEIERSQTVWVVLDSGRLMRTRVGGLSKLDYAVNAALALTEVALSSGDSVGVLAYARRIVQRLPPARGRGHLKDILEQLALVREDEWEADHLLAAGRVLTDQKRRGLIVWITDLAETAMTPEVIRASATLTSRHVLLFVVIGQPDLQALARRTPTTISEMYDGAAAQELVQRRDLLLATLRDRGALALETSAGGLSPALVNAYLQVKQQSRL